MWLPEIANRLGGRQSTVRRDWEVDTIIGAGHEGVLVSAGDRTSKHTALKAVATTTKALVGEALVTRPQPVSYPVRTVTADNVREFDGYREFGATLDADACSARPYRSGERGLNEDANALIRQYFGNGENLRHLAPGQARPVAFRLNGRAREALGFHTPPRSCSRPLPEPPDRSVRHSLGVRLRPPRKSPRRPPQFTSYWKK